MNLFTAVLYLHIATVAVSVGLFVLRYWWSWSGNRLLDQRWVRIVPLESGEVLQKARTWVLTDLKGVRTTLSIEAFRRHGDGFIAKWAGCETKEAADAARGLVTGAASAESRR